MENKNEDALLELWNEFVKACKEHQKIYEQEIKPKIEEWRAKDKELYSEYMKKRNDLTKLEQK